MANGRSTLINQGRKAYCPGDNPAMECPYNDDIMGNTYRRSCWLQGWHEEEIEAEKAAEEEQNSFYLKYEWIPAKDDILGAIQQIQDILDKYLRKT